MQIQLEDFDNGRPIVVKTTNEIATKIRAMKGKKQYQDMYELTVTLPNNKQKYLMQANALMHLKKWKQLSETCDKGLQLQEDSDFYNLKGKALGKMEQYHQKIQLTKKAIQIDGKVPAYHRNLGAGYYKVKQYEKAIEAHNKAIKLQPKNSINYHNKGAALFRMKKYQQAKQSFESAISFDRKQVISYAWLADSERQLGNYQRLSQITNEHTRQVGTKCTRGKNKKQNRKQTREVRKDFSQKYLVDALN